MPLATYGHRPPGVQPTGSELELPLASGHPERPEASRPAAHRYRPRLSRRGARASGQTLPQGA
eukprot:1184281-Prorocentrum_minimum.AAC.1